ncbi:ubiquitin-associated domain-containing protein 2 [Aplysia californica]|uniref:Ubiquitin-associated domain-containing protein 2 n=1 Tax=Aplysia californica TaxID=6500 RepID=A0ABM0JHP0_APLCA|nr:ubiquitin-associated domain-containing protein 2 [Aplysia californica]XP_005093889.1 ubiquitin-associated domain-containing protein 2 [Aplysia californica]
MIALAGPAGFYGAPATKVLLCHAIITYFLFAFPLQHFHQLFHYNQDVFEKRQFKKMLVSKLVFLELPDLLFSAVLFYNFRIFERRFGTRKFVSHLLSTTIIASILELLVFAVLNRLEIQLGTMPSGLFSMVFPLFVPFFCTIPRVAIMRVVGVPVTGKTINYILGLQMASAEVENMLVVACALLAGILWRANFLKVQAMLQVPVFVARAFEYCLGRFLESPDLQKTSLPMGATLELQQRERLDRIEQQMMASAIQASRHMDIGRPQPINVAQGPGIFGNVVRRAGQAQAEQQSPDDSGSASSSGGAVSEDQVQRFVEMGFNDAQVRQALRFANNNPRLATNFLLQDM